MANDICNTSASSWCVLIYLLKSYCNNNRAMQLVEVADRQGTALSPEYSLVQFMVKVSTVNIVNVSTVAIDECVVSNKKYNRLKQLYEHAKCI